LVARHLSASGFAAKLSATPEPGIDPIAPDAQTIMTVLEHPQRRAAT